MKRPKPLADLVTPVIGPALAAQGFTGADVVASWSEIVGARLGERSRPIRVEWPRRGRDAARDGRPEPATLVVRVESAFALELQHQAPLVLERVNGHYGWRCVGRLVLKQGPVALPRAARRPMPEPTEEEGRRIAQAVAPLADEALRGALERLGRAVVPAGEAQRHADGGMASPPSP